MTIRSNNKERFDLDLGLLWSLLEEHLFLVARGFSCEVNALVLMPNHLHLLIYNHEANLDQMMNYFLRELSRDIGRRTDRINHIFGNRYFSSVIQDWTQLQTVYKYVYQNPVKAGLAQTALEYPFSTLPGLFGLRKILVPIVDPMDVTEDSRQVLEWLGDGYEKETWERIRKGLKHNEFVLAGRKVSRKKEDEGLGFRSNAQQIKKERGTFDQIISK